MTPPPVYIVPRPGSFSRYICDLLQQLDDELRKPPHKQLPSEPIVQSWFQQHDSLIRAPGNDACAIISTLLPERRTDRVYGIQAPRLQSIFGKALMLGASRVLELRRWAEPGSGIDLADCVEGVLRRTPNSRDDTTHLTVEEIDEILGCIAAACRFSSPAVRALHRTSNARDPNDLLASIYTRLGSRDAKWFTRLVLKNYQPVALNAHTVFRNYHPLLPQMMKIRDDLSFATAYVRHIDEKIDTPSIIASHLKPRLGTKVGRQPWFKGRSMKNCMDIAQGREVVCEQKIDGEYCQIHIDLRKPGEHIQIFSKSGKDSTADRIRLHKSVTTSWISLKFQERRILPFHKIRKHVSRSGSFLGTANDSQAHDYEHLMIIYYDVLLIDDESLLGVKNSERFRRLNEIVTCREGYAELVPRTTISTSQTSAVQALRELFAQCISARGEGLVLKPDEPYFDFNPTARRYGCCNVKLKKEYIQGWGDVGDFAVVGASYDAAKAREYRLTKVMWTHFFIGCLENGHQARAKTEMPRFRVTNIVELTGPILSAFWAQQSPISVPHKDNTYIQLDYMFDVRCFGFDKEPNTKFWNTVTFSELQGIAEAAARLPEEEDSQEMRQWVKALERMERGKFSVDAVSQATTCSDAPPSPASSTSVRSPTRHLRRDLPKPPRSSAIEATIASRHTKSMNSTISVVTHTKRSATERLGPDCAAKRHCGHSGPSSIDSSQQSSPTDSLFARTRQREPLSQLDLNASEQHRIGPERPVPAPSLPTQSTQGDTDLPAEKPPASSPAAYYTASEMVSSPSDRATEPRQRSKKSQSPSKTKSPSFSCCSITSSECALASCSILLAPCISSYAWITDDLLNRHGIIDPLLDPRVWNSSSYMSMYKSRGSFECGSTTLTGTPARRPRLRKICLVESRRKEATRAFLQKIKDADLKKRNGEQEWVTVYDWRVLEAITKQESQEKPLGGADPWRHFYVGIV
ncbi:hypothetical protein NUW58_g7495 [Xylaria curta]|uniref:Uncharacterized protein n=1 Tax=Xylaria curta TaxID=42375 RepID=A0ACC1NGI2_9PEZI|nr:hypothetical protein NUW58_g7495 [Xylaria curta]